MTFIIYKCAFLYSFNLSAGMFYISFTPGKDESIYFKPPFNDMTVLLSYKCKNDFCLPHLS